MSCSPFGTTKADNTKFLGVSPLFDFLKPLSALSARRMISFIRGVRYFSLSKNSFSGKVELTIVLLAFQISILNKKSS